MLAVADDGASVDDHVGDVGAHHDLGRVGAGRPDAGQVDGDQVGAGAGLDPAGIGPAESVVAGLSREAEQVVGGEGAAASGGEAFVLFQAAGLADQVDLDVLIAAQAERAAGLLQRGERSNAVGEIGFGGRAGADRRLRRAEQVDVPLAQVNRVDGGGVRSEGVGGGEQFGRRVADGGLVLGRLLGEVDVQRQCVSPCRGGGRLNQGQTHRVGFVVGGAARPVMQVVELPHAADAGGGHLGVDGGGKSTVAVGGEPSGNGIHARSRRLPCWDCWRPASEQYSAWPSAPPMGIIATTWNGAEPVVVLSWLAAGLFVIAVPLVAGAVAAQPTSAKPTSIMARPD